VGSEDSLMKRIDEISLTEASELSEIPKLEDVLLDETVGE
jgi:hypothetical protein